MVAQNLLGEFLRARRELARPEEHGLPDLGRRRVPGLRREEVAMLAGVSAEYYIRLERGRDRNPSDQVLDALARVLGLDRESRTYLASLVARVPGTPTIDDRETVRPGVLRMLDGLSGVPAFVLGRFMDVLAYNRCAEVLHGRPMNGNLMRDVFLDPATRELYPDWEEVAAESVASLRGLSAGHIDDPRLTSLVGELSLKCADFARLWARHDIRNKANGTKRIASPTVGLVTITWEGFAVTSAPGQLLIAYFADAHTASGDALRKVAALAAEYEQAVVTANPES